MRTRFCLNCGEPYESEAKDDTRLPFCSKDCRVWYKMTNEERVKEINEKSLDIQKEM